MVLLISSRAVSAAAFEEQCKSKHRGGVVRMVPSPLLNTVMLMIHRLSAGFTATVWPIAAPVGPTGQLYNSTTTFTVVANMGVILFMFLLGCELDQTLLARQWRRSAPIALSAIMFPFGVGAAASVWLEVRNSQLKWLKSSLLLRRRQGWGQECQLAVQGDA
jgi:hypothetical protein